MSIEVLEILGIALDTMETERGSKRQPYQIRVIQGYGVSVQRVDGYHVDSMATTRRTATPSNRFVLSGVAKRSSMDSTTCVT